MEEKLFRVHVISLRTAAQSAFKNLHDCVMKVEIREKSIKYLMSQRDDLENKDFELESLTLASVKAEFTVNLV